MCVKTIIKEEETMKLVEGEQTRGVEAQKGEPISVLTDGQNLQTNFCFFFCKMRLPGKWLYSVRMLGLVCLHRLNKGMLMA